MNRTRLRTAGASLAIAALVLAACGGDDSSGSEPDPTSASTAAPGATSPGSTAVDAPADSSAPAGSSSATSAAGSTPATDPAGEPQSGGTFTFLVNNEMRRGIDPVQGTGAAAGGDGFRMFALYGALLTLNGETGAADPVMAESFTPDPTFTTWTLKLRDGITFSDGTPYDAEAVKFNWARHADPALASPRVGTASRLTLTVVAPLTLEVGLAAPDSTLDLTVAAELTYIASPTALALPGEYAEHPSGAGPFVLDEWVRDSRMVLSRNPDYWDAPRPYLDKVEIRVVADDQQRINSFSGGEGQALWMQSLNPQQVAEDNDAGFMKTANLGSNVYLFNLTRAPFDDIRVRQAVQLALDTHQMHLAAQGFEPPDDLRTLLSSASPWTDDTDDTLKLPAPDPDQARELFAEYVAEKGPINILIGAGNSALGATQTEYIQATLQEYPDVSVEISLMDTAAHTNRLISGEFDLASSAFQGVEPFSQFAGSLVTGGARNLGKITDPEIDALFADARSTIDRDQQLADVLDAQRLAVAGTYTIPVGRSSSGVIFDEEAVHNLQLYEDGVVRLDQLWVTG